MTLKATESTSRDTATTDVRAPSAARTGAKNATPASASPSPQTARSGTAGTADGPAVSATAAAYAASRGISEATLVKLGVGSGTVFFPTLGRKCEALFWPYHLDGELVNWKATAVGEKAFTSLKGGRLEFAGLDRLKGDTLYITEGEWDMAALVEAGAPSSCVTTVPNGAAEKPAEADEPVKGYGYTAELLSRMGGGLKRIVWCGDNDAPGLSLRRDMARVFGAARFWFVEWPEGCKDANDMLRSDGPEALHELVTTGALPWPVAGLYRMSEIPEPPPIQTWEPGFPEWEGKVKLAPGTMSVVTGHPGHGKTQLWMQVWQQVAERHDITICAASFETRAKPHQRRALRSLLSGRLEKDMAPEDIRRADAWINDHYLWLSHPDQRPTLDWLLDMAEVAVVRHGAKVVQVDPWNRLESQRDGRESETDYIGRSLTALYVFAQDFGVHVQVLAHPAKMDSKARGQPPALEDIAGSKHWDNRVDQGFVVHRPRFWDDDNGRSTDAVLYQRKARFEELGYPCKLALRYDLKAARYLSTDFEDRFGNTA